MDGGTGTVDDAVAQRQRAMWALGDYSTVASDLIPSLGVALVEACGVAAGDRVLDVAAGSGNAALPAALRGASVVASDLTPELLDRGRAVGAGLPVEWREADARDLPFDDDSFDVVMSCVGVMFAPDHARCAGELTRVCRSGGTVGILSWTPTGFVGRMLTTMQPYVPPPPPGAVPPPRWGDEDHVRALFDGSVTSLSARTDAVRIDRFATPEEFVAYFRENYGPTVAAYRGLAGEPDRQAALDRDLARLAADHHVGGDALAMDWEYLLVTARVA